MTVADQIMGRRNQGIRNNRMYFCRYSLVNLLFFCSSTDENANTDVDLAKLIPKKIVSIGVHMSVACPNAPAELGRRDGACLAAGRPVTWFCSVLRSRAALNSQRGKGAFRGRVRLPDRRRSVLGSFIMLGFGWKEEDRGLPLPGPDHRTD
jgi:hypothetical protein